MGIYVGNQKPDKINSYFEDFVLKAELVLSQGLLFDGNQFEKAIQSFICDAPARSFVCSIKNHTRYYGC